MAPIENIKGIIDNIEKSNNSKEEKEYAKKVLDSATKKGIETVALNADAKSQLDFLLKDMSIDSETATNQLADSLTPTRIDSTKTTDTETINPSEGYTENYNTPTQGEAERAFENAEKERGEGGWTNLYVMAKMISLGYIPKLHDLKYHSDFKGQKIKWVWNNAKYMSVGGPITNGTINNDLFKKGQEKANAFILKQVFSEESQIKILLTQVQNSDISNMDRTNLNERLRNFAEIKTALNSGNLANVRTAFTEYTRISGETPEKLRKQIADQIKGVRVEQKKALDTSIKEKTAKVQTNVEKSKTTAKEQITKSLDAEIKKIEAEIKTSNDTETNRKTSLTAEIEALEKQKTSIEELNKKLTEKEKVLDGLKAKRLEVINGHNTISTILGPNGEIIPSSPSKLKEQLDIDILAKESEIAKLESEITTNQTHNTSIDGKIEAKKVELNSVKNSSELNALGGRKKLVGEMKANLDKGNIKVFRGQMLDYKNLNSENDIVGIKERNLKYLSINHDDIIKSKEDKIRQTETQKSKVDTKNKVLAARENVPQKEIDRINKEMRDIEHKIDQLKQEATRKLTQLDNIAKNHPERVPELKKQAEALVETHNREIVKLESLGVENVKSLNIEQLKGVAQDSKLLTGIANANKGLDKLSSGVTGKVMGVGAIMLVGAGVKGAFDKDGFSQETALNVADIGFGMIPVAGGVYDLYRAYQGTDLNGKTMSSEERLMRTGFGIVGLVPGLGTAVKWAGRTGKMVKTAEGTSKIMKTGDVIIEGGHLTGKVMSLSALGYSAVSTTTYLLPAHTTK